ncbi:helix-turn-helix domain-containing protein [Streptomyces sp. NPDC054796]
MPARREDLVQTAEMPEMLLPPPDLGAVVRAARAAARMTQTQLGLKCGYSHSAISRIETGQVTPDWHTVRTLATVLRIPPEALGMPRTGGSPPLPPHWGADPTRVPGRGDFEAPEDAVRRRKLLALTGQAAAATALAGVLPAPSAAAAPGRDPDLSALEQALVHGTPQPDIEPTAVARQRAVAAARRALAAGDYLQLAADLPRHLALADATEGEQGASTRSALYSIAARAAIKSGDDPLVLLAADRALLHARACGDAVALAEARRMLSSGYRRHDRHDRALDTIVRAADDLAADRTAPAPTRLSELGNLYATAAYTAAKAGDGPTARELLDSARATAARLTTTPAVQGTPGGAGWFGPRQVALHEVSVHHILGDPGAALACARRVDPRGLPRERAARLFLDTARAHLAAGRPREGFRALLAIERAAPQEAHRESVRTLTRSLLNRRGTTAELTAFAQRTGAA